MELGAKICSFKSPRCLICPVQSSCIAFRTGLQEKIPPVKKRPATVHVHLFAMVHKRGNRYLMKPADGMWEFPMSTEPALSAGLQKLGECQHTITHHRLRVSVYEARTEAPDCVWKEIDKVPISSLTRKILLVYGDKALHQGKVSG